jgi:hypothetical protein
MNPGSPLFTVTCQPRDDYYDEFIDWVGAHADRGCVVVHPDLGIEGTGEKFFRDLSPLSRVKSKHQSGLAPACWPAKRLRL